MNVLIIGLPLFTQRLVDQLNATHDGNKYKRFDTYYKKWDKLRFAYYLQNADLVYSINGAICESGAFDRVLKQGKKLVMHWVGTDVITAKKNFENGKINQDYIDKATHFCEVGWIQEELKEIGIEAKILNFISFTGQDHVSAFPDRFSALTYISSGREEFYGIKEIYALAEAMPEIQINVAGIDSYGKMSKPGNVNLLGWVDDMSKRVDESVVCIRLAEHDGLSGFVLEALSQARQVIYRFDFNYCINAKNSEELVAAVTDLKNQFDANTLQLNTRGAEFIKKDFNREFILSNLAAEFESALNNE